MYLIKKLNLEQVTKIYKEELVRHFPADEVKPLKSIERMWKMGAYQAFGLYEMVSDELMGYAFFSKKPGNDMILMDYLAVLEEHRNKGLGAVFLQEMKAIMKEYKGILIETEDVDFAQNVEEVQVCQKRDAFYKRNGVIKIDVKSAIYGVHYANWIYPIDTEWNVDECREELRAIYQVMIPGEKYEKFVRIE